MTERHGTIIELDELTNPCASPGGLTMIWPASTDLETQADLTTPPRPTL
jgi:hypothetical protein